MFDWDDFLAVAESLATDPNNEAAARSAISRAYYAAFHAGRENLVRTGIPLDRSRNAHIQVRHAFWESSKKVSENLERRHELRKQADYDNPFSPDPSVLAEVAALAIALARQTIGEIDALP